MHCEGQITYANNSTYSGSILSVRIPSLVDDLTLEWLPDMDKLRLTQEREREAINETSGPPTNGYEYFRDGKGIYTTTASGRTRILEGIFCRDSFVRGTLIETTTTTESEKYVGEFGAHNVFHGAGIHAVRRRTALERRWIVYKGTFVNGVREGVGGSLVEVDFEVDFEGDFVGDVSASASASDVFDSFDLVSGDVVAKARGLEGGKVLKIRTYSGDFWRGMESGPNGINYTWTPSMSETYEGNFVCGLRSGHGSLRCNLHCNMASSSVLSREGLSSSVLSREGTFRAGVSVAGNWVIRFATGDVYSGHSLDGFSPHGHGTMKSATGDVYTGTWSGGLRHGKGIAVFGEGEEWEGEFFNGEPVGLCDWTSAGDSMQGDSMLAEVSLETTDPKMMQSNSSSSSSNSSRSNSTKNLHKRSFSFTGNLDDNHRPHGEGEYESVVYSIKKVGTFCHGIQQEGFISIGNALTYSGSFHPVTGNFHGQGVLVDAAGTTYRGEFVDGLKSGAGLLEDLTSGTRYIGSFCNGVKSGIGTITRIDDADSQVENFVYSGEFADDVYHGEGIHQLEGYRYKGNFRNGLKHGLFSVESLTGKKTSFFECEMVENQRVAGDGRIVYEEQGEYCGWVNIRGGREGQGIMKYSNGDVYSGEWVNDERSGKGTMIYQGGEQFSGEWKDDKIDERGSGKLTLADGRVHEYTKENDTKIENESKMK